MTRGKHPIAIQGATRGKSDGIFVIVKGNEKKGGLLFCSFDDTDALCDAFSVTSRRNHKAAWKRP